MNRAILVLNSGSSSIKFALYSADGNDEQALLTGKISGIGRAPRFKASDNDGSTLVEDGLAQIDPAAGHGELTMRLLD